VSRINAVATLIINSPDDAPAFHWHIGEGNHQDKRPDFHRNLLGDGNFVSVHRQYSTALRSTPKTYATIRLFFAIPP
jgi:hypothetical protein